MKIVTLPVGLLGTNCYLVENGQKEAVLIDPGAQPDKLIRYLKSEGLTLQRILLTHGHFDHIGGVSDLVQEWNVPVCIHAADEEMAQSPLLNASLDFGDEGISCRVDEVFTEGDVIPFGELQFRVIHTPGHSKGSVCFLLENVLFTGDTVFVGSIGRTDLHGGSYPQIAASAKKIAALPQNYQLLPGHGEPTTLNREREMNPYLATEWEI